MFNLEQKLEHKLFESLQLCYDSLNKQINLKTFKPANSFSSRANASLGKHQFFFWSKPYFVLCPGKLFLKKIHWLQNSP